MAPQVVTATECHMAKIRNQDTGIEPQTLNLKVNDCVVFMNSSSPLYRPTAKPQDVKVVFNEGEKCLAATQSIVGLAIDDDKRLVSDWIGAGQINPVFSKPGVYNYSGQPSVVFTKPGVYNYKVLYKTGGPSVLGVIKVE